MTAIKIEIPALKLPEDFFAEIKEMIRAPNRLCNPTTGKIGIENISLWAMERMVEIKQQDEEMAREIRLLVSKKPELIEEIRSELKKAEVTERVEKQLFKAIFVRLAD